MSPRVRIFGFTVALVVVSLTFFECGSKPPCNAMTCATGCCDASGTCQGGSSASACGKGGEMCADCSAGTKKACSALSQTCVPAGGTGGSSTGGGSGTGGGTGTGGGSGTGGGAQACLQLSMVRPIDTYAGYEDNADTAPYDHYVLGAHYDDMVTNAPVGTTQLWVELWSDGTSFPVLPAARTFDTANRYNLCDVCIGIGTGCDSNGDNCTKQFFSVGGSANVTHYDLNAASGRITATGTALKFAEWTFASSGDSPTPNGQCIELTGFNMNIPWGAATTDGGTDGGNIDGGTDAGITDAGTTDAGTSDAGSTDAGDADAGDVDAGDGG